ncbi:MAG: class I SAM-dependent methyltransferase [Bacteroidales bacterium]|nr:class I SAM-dependent methyltransferase [Bacteroidales bacterium]
MKSVKDLRTFIKSSYSTEHFYKSMNLAFEKYYGQYLMLHFPFFKNASDDLEQSQKNLTHHCISKLPGITGKNVLEIGCGNGIQSMYLHQKFDPLHLTGIDINEYSISIAQNEVKKRSLQNIAFFVDNSQELNNIADNSMDIVVNIESAFHYPDKEKFIQQVNRVLKPGGAFVIADITNRKKREKEKPARWNRGMNLHHWTDGEYRETFSKNNFVLSSYEDITIRIIDGFRTYRNWNVKNNSLNFFQRMMVKIFLLINVRVNIYLFSKKRNYFVYSGLKAA